MASDVVRIGREAKKLLEAMRARLALETGRQYTLQELVDAAIAIASRRYNELLEELGEWSPLSREEAERLLEEYSIDADVEDVERDLREALYSGSAG